LIELLSNTELPLFMAHSVQSKLVSK